MKKLVVITLSVIGVSAAGYFGFKKLREIAEGLEDN